MPFSRTKSTRSHKGVTIGYTLGPYSNFHFVSAQVSMVSFKTLRINFWCLRMCYMRIHTHITHTHTPMY